MNVCKAFLAAQPFSHRFNCLFVCKINFFLNLFDCFLNELVVYAKIAFSLKIVILYYAHEKVEKS